MFFPTVEMTNRAVDVAHHFKYEGRWLDAFLVKVRFDAFDLFFFFFFQCVNVSHLGSAVDGRSLDPEAHSTHKD